MIKYQGPTLATAQTFTAAQTISVTDNTNAALKVVQSGTGDVLQLLDGGSDITPTIVDQVGNVVVGHTAAQTYAGGATPKVQVVTGATSDASTIGLQNWSNTVTDSAAGIIRFAKSRGGGIIGTHGVVSSATVLGEIAASGSDGTAFIPAAQVRFEMDGTPGTNDMPAKIVLGTTADGAATVTDRWQIGQQGMLRALSGSFSRGAPVTKTADFTVADTENWLINNKAGSTCAVTLPAAASYPGREITIKNLQAQLVNSASSNVVPLGSTTAGTAILTANAGRWATLVSDATNWVIMAGVV